MIRLFLAYLLSSLSLLSAQWVQTSDLDGGSADFQDVQVGIDATGTAVAIWEERPGISLRNEIRGAKLPCCTTDWERTSTVSDIEHDVKTPVLSVSQNGEALAIWAAKDFSFSRFKLHGSRLHSGHHHWERTKDLATDLGLTYADGDSALAVDCVGNAIAVWVDPIEQVVRGAKLKIHARDWYRTDDVTGSKGTHSKPLVAMTPYAEGVAIWENSDMTVDGARIFAKSREWRATSRAVDQAVQFKDLSVDQEKEAIVAYSAFFSLVSSTRLPPDSLNWESFANDLSTGFSYAVKVGTSCDGYAVAIWNAGGYSVEGAIRLPGSSTWIPTSTVSPQSGSIDVTASPYIAVDQFGDAVALFVSGDLQSVQASILPVGSTTWEATTALITGASLKGIADLALTPDGATAVAVWLSQDAVQGAKARDLFPPMPPGNIQGKQLLNTFGLESEWFNRIYWAPSPSSTVVSYLLYRNGVLIKTYPNQGGQVFEDHNQRKGALVVYEVVAVSETGKKSKPIRVEVQ